MDERDSRAEAIRSEAESTKDTADRLANGTLPRRRITSGRWWAW
jgi:hypothetical protein